MQACANKESLLDEKQLKTSFQFFDKDGSGSVTTDELKDALGIGKNIDEKVWIDVIKEVDVNGDGEIDFEEFVKAFLAGGAREDERHSRDEAAAAVGASSRALAPHWMDDPQGDAAPRAARAALAAGHPGRDGRLNRVGRKRADVRPGDVPLAPHEQVVDGRGGPSVPMS